MTPRLSFSFASMPAMPLLALLWTAVGCAASAPPDSSSASNWLACTHLRDCDGTGAAACTDGFCVDASGEPIETTLGAVGEDAPDGGSASKACGNACEDGLESAAASVAAAGPTESLPQELQGLDCVELDDEAYRRKVLAAIAHSQCEVDADCALFSQRVHGCTQGCASAINRGEFEAMGNAMGQLDESICAARVAKGCPTDVNTGSCIGIWAACVQGQCIEVAEEPELGWCADDQDAAWHYLPGFYAGLGARCDGPSDCVSIKVDGPCFTGCVVGSTATEQDSLAIIGRSDLQAQRCLDEEGAGCSHMEVSCDRVVPACVDGYCVDSGS